jgi:hypothetical protein
VQCLCNDDIEIFICEYWKGRFGLSLRQYLSSPTGTYKECYVESFGYSQENLSTGTSICTVLETSTVAKDRHQDNSALLASTNTTKNNDGVARASVRW